MKKYNTIIAVFTDRKFKDKDNFQHLNWLIFMVKSQDENKLTYDNLDKRIDNLSKNERVDQLTIVNIDNNINQSITQKWNNFKIININYDTFFNSEQLTKFLNENKTNKYYIFKGINYEDLIVKFRSFGILVLPELTNDSITITHLHF